MSIFDEILKSIENEAKYFQTQDGKDALHGLGVLFLLSLIGYLITHFLFN